MAIVPVQDLNPDRDDPRFAAPTLPCNIEAEQCVLGCILYDNRVFETLPQNLVAEHFFEPFHQRLFAQVDKLIRQGQLADLVLVMDAFGGDPAFEDLGGLQYLADLVDRAPPGVNAPDYARAITDLSVRRELIRLGHAIAASAGDPSNELSGPGQIEEAESALYGLAETGSTSQGFVPLSQMLSGALGMVSAAFARDGEIGGLPTGLIDLDKKVGGLHPSDVIILAARPSMGKTSLAVNIGFRIAKSYQTERDETGEEVVVRGGVVGMFTLEMSSEQLAMRILSEVSGVSGERMRNGDIDETEVHRIMDASMEIADSPFFADATGGISIATLGARARRLKRTHGLHLLIVDYLQLVTGTGHRQNRVEVVTEVTQGLKALAKELDIPIIALAQLSRQVENRDDKRPMLADLRESGSIEQDADAVWFIYREEYYLSRSEPKEGTPAHLEWQDAMDKARNQAELIIGKQRHGPIGSVKLAFNSDLTMFTNLARESMYDSRRD